MVPTFEGVGLRVEHAAFAGAHDRRENAAQRRDPMWKHTHLTTLGTGDIDVKTWLGNAALFLNRSLEPAPMTLRGIPMSLLPGGNESLERVSSGHKNLPNRIHQPHPIT